jgi:ABC-type multidrug transport system permease subunit
MSSPLSSFFVVFVLVLVDGLDVASKVVVGEVLAAKLTGVAQFHQLSPPFSLFMFFLVSLELGSSDFFATLTHDSSKLEPIKEFNDSIMAFLGLFSLTFR